MKGDKTIQYKEKETFLEQDLERSNLGRLEVQKGIANRGNRMKFKYTSHIQRNKHYAKGNTGIWG